MSLLDSDEVAAGMALMYADPQIAATIEDASALCMALEHGAKESRRKFLTTYLATRAISDWLGDALAKRLGKDELEKLYAVTLVGIGHRLGKKP